MISARLARARLFDIVQNAHPPPASRREGERLLLPVGGTRSKDLKDPKEWSARHLDCSERLGRSAISHLAILLNLLDFMHRLGMGRFQRTRCNIARGQIRS